MTTSVEELRSIGARASQLLAEIGTVYRTRTRKQTQLDDRIKKVQERYGPEVESLQNQQNALVRQLVGLVLPHFDDLAAEGTKTIKLRSGELSLRLGPEALQIDNDEDVINQLRRRAVLKAFTKVTRTIDKVALKKRPELVSKLKGVTVVRSEKLHIKPTKLRGTEITLSTDNLTVTVPEGG
jgi:phage host-nuclease inhibitor protein Gam